MIETKRVIEKDDFVIFGFNGDVRTGQIQKICPKTVKLKLDTGYDKRIRISDILEVIKCYNERNVPSF